MLYMPEVKLLVPEDSLRAACPSHPAGDQMPLAGSRIQQAGAPRIQGAVDRRKEVFHQAAGNRIEQVAAGILAVA